MKQTLAALASAALLAGCTAETPETQSQDLTVAADDADTYYVATRVDTRKCIYPLCGGWFVARLNRAKTRCADGKLRDECHVAKLDRSALALDDEKSGPEFESTFSAGQAIVRGALTTTTEEGLSYGVETLIASEGWTATGFGDPWGDFFHVQDNGIVCITYPCSSIHQIKVNTATERNIAGVDLYLPDAPEDVVMKGYEQLGNPGLMAQGWNAWTYGPAGWARELIAWEFYFKVPSAALECAADACGPALGMPNTLCDDGVSASGPTGKCLQNADGSCGWEVLSCPE